MRETRKQLALALLETATKGPDYVSWDFDHNTKHQEEAKEAYRIWSRSWLLPKLERLIPELKEKTK